MTREIIVRDSTHANKINQVACSYGFDVWMSAGNSILDAKSSLSVQTFVGQKANIVVEDDIDKRVFDRMVRAMA